METSLDKGRGSGVRKEVTEGQQRPNRDKIFTTTDAFWGQDLQNLWDESQLILQRQEDGEIEVQWA